jgi:hypothetical protein
MVVITITSVFDSDEQLAGVADGEQVVAYAR